MHQNLEDTGIMNYRVAVVHACLHACIHDYTCIHYMYIATTVLIVLTHAGYNSLRYILMKTPNISKH